MGGAVTRGGTNMARKKKSPCLSALSRGRALFFSLFLLLVPRTSSLPAHRDRATRRASPLPSPLFLLRVYSSIFFLPSSSSGGVFYSPSPSLLTVASSPFTSSPLLVSGPASASPTRPTKTSSRPRQLTSCCKVTASDESGIWYSFDRSSPGLECVRLPFNQFRQATRICWFRVLRPRSLHCHLHRLSLRHCPPCKSFRWVATDAVKQDSSQISRSPSSGKARPFF